MPTVSSSRRASLGEGTVAEVEDRIKAVDAWLSALPPAERERLGVVWGKSRGLVTPNPLLQHLFDSLCVADLIWQHYLAPCLQDRLDEIADGRGRSLLSWLAGCHDIGKCTPAFQVQDPALSDEVRAAGLSVKARRVDSQRWRHDLAGAVHLRKIFAHRWTDADQVAWVWPIIGGHHGLFYAQGATSARPRVLADPRVLVRHGDESWDEVRTNLAEVIAIAAGYEGLEYVQPLRVPSRADQLAVVGFVMMADWIASDGDCFRGVSEPSLASAQKRAAAAWQDLGLRRGWGRLAEPPPDPYQARFGYPARPCQELVVQVANEVGAASLVIIEAPMGEGKTEAALVGAEILAHRFGADGIAIGMPTQATADPMLTRVAAWLATVDDQAELALLHGRSAFNAHWQQMQDRRRQPVAAAPDTEVQVDQYGEPIDLEEFDGGHHAIGAICEDDHSDEPDHITGTAAAEWLFGRHRGLLAPNLISTIDQELFAATRIRSVAIRYAGLAGKVVVFDEIHAADEYMTEFLVELLAWLGGGRVPVILLSATLAARQRERLVAAYVGGALGDPDRQPEPSTPLPGYPAVTAVWADGGAPRRLTRTAPPSRIGSPVDLSVIDEPENDPDRALTVELPALIDDGGTVLVIRNTVDRAQRAAALLRERYGDEVVLLHSRFTTRHRADITEGLVRELGPSATRPLRRIVVATQIAEQSFDVDADLLVTDIAPVDLLLQRIGRLHRHDRHNRPPRLETPRVLVTGVHGAGTDRPTFDSGSEAIYGRHRLLRSLAAIASGPWLVPDDIARLVEEAYEPEPRVPESWAADEATARAAWDQKVSDGRAKAQSYRLTRAGHRSTPTLENLSGAPASIRDVDTYVNVREGDSGEEVLLVVRASGRYRTLAGVDLGIYGERVRDLDIRDVLGDTVRLPGRNGALNAAARELPTLPDWHDHPWLARTHVLVLDDAHAGTLDDKRVHYTPTTGLTLEKSP